MIGDQENIAVMYLDEIGRIPLMNREEEAVTARKAADGDRSAKDKLIRSNLRFVVNVAKRYQNLGLPLMDLISEGNIGLMKAVERFDVNKGWHFITYAVWWIRQSILKALCSQSRLVRLPVNRACELVRIQRTRKEIRNTNSLHGPAEVKAVAMRLQLEVKHVDHMLNIANVPISIESALDGCNSTSGVEKQLEGRNGESHENHIVQNSVKDEIAKILKHLSEREADIIRYRFGLDGKHPHSLREVAEIYMLTKERIRQIEKKAVSRLRTASEEHQLEAYLA